MKDLKEKSRTRKSSKDEKRAMTIDTIVGKTWPGEVEIREKAEEIYYQRIERGEYGTPEEDWFRAKEYLRD